MTNKNNKSSDNKATKQFDLEEMLQKMDEDALDVVSKSPQEDSGEQNDAKDEQSMLKDVDASVQASNDLLEVSAKNTALDEELFNKHKSSIVGAMQFEKCILPSISYYSKRPVCDVINNMKRINDRSKESYDGNIELLEKAIAYLYARKHNLHYSN